MMPHLERSTFPWNWAHYPENRKKDSVSPWVIAFQNAYNWLINLNKFNLKINIFKLFVKTKTTL